MATWYKSGTVNVTNGSTAVVGVGTLWQLNGVTTGDLFTLDGDTFYEIAAVTGETALTLASNYGGTTQTGQTYAIIRNMTNTTNAELAAKVATLVNAWQTRENEFRAWHGGTVSGGPGGDGRYPLTDALGNTQNIACPAKLAANVLSPSLDTLSVDAAYKTLIVDSVNHRVGFGTNAPLMPIDVAVYHNVGYVGNEGSSGNLVGAGIVIRNTCTNWYGEDVPAAHMYFRCDSGISNKAIARISCVKEGGGTSSSLRFATMVSSVMTERMRITEAGRMIIGYSTDNGIDKAQINGSVYATQYKLSDLNTAPASATDSGTKGEIRITATHIYVCIATNTWVRSPLSTW